LHFFNSKDADESKLAPSKRILLKRKMEEIVKIGVVSEDELTTHKKVLENSDTVTAL
jgi:hypothetical protein